MNRDRFAVRLRSSKGANLAETAMIIPLLLLLTFAIIDFSTVLYVYLTLENGVSQATRYAVTGQQIDDPNNMGQKLSREQSVKAAMRAAVPTLTIDDSCFQFYNLTKATSGAGGPGDLIRVTINYDWSAFTPLIKPIVNGQIHLTVQSTMKNEAFPTS